MDGVRDNKKHIYPNNHINIGQLTNDVFLTVIHMPALAMVKQQLLPALRTLKQHLLTKVGYRMTFPPRQAQTTFPLEGGRALPRNPHFSVFA